jgi:hypothetical protein
MDGRPRARVVAPHAPDAEWAGRRFGPAEVLEVERDDPAWPDWLLCKLPDGSHAWLPKADLEVRGDSATLTNEYDSTELNSEAGDIVSIDRTYGGWALCLTGDGRRGWLPEEKLASL